MITNLVFLKNVEQSTHSESDSESSRGGTKTGRERAAEIEPTKG